MQTYSRFTAIDFMLFLYHAVYCEFVDRSLPFDLKRYFSFPKRLNENFVPKRPTNRINLVNYITSSWRTGYTMQCTLQIASFSC